MVIKSKRGEATRMRETETVKVFHSDREGYIDTAGVLQIIKK